MVVSSSSSSSSTSLQAPHALLALGSPVGARTRARAHIKQEGEGAHLKSNTNTTTLTTTLTTNSGAAGAAGGAAAGAVGAAAAGEGLSLPPPPKPTRRMHSATGAVLSPLALVLAKATTNRYCVAASVVSYAPKDLSRFVRRYEGGAVTLNLTHPSPYPCQYHPLVTTSSSSYHSLTPLITSSPLIPPPSLSHPTPIPLSPHPYPSLTPPLSLSHPIPLSPHPSLTPPLSLSNPPPSPSHPTPIPLPPPPPSPMVQASGGARRVQFPSAHCRQHGPNRRDLLRQGSRVLPR